jgi:hypothetical protein
MEKIFVLNKKAKLDDYNGYDFEFIVLSKLKDDFYNHSEMVYIYYPSSVLSEIDKENIQKGDCLKLSFYCPDGYTDFKYSLYSQLSKKEYTITKINVNEYDYIINSFEMMFDSNRHKNRNISYYIIPSLKTKESLVTKLKILKRSNKINNVLNN